MLHKFCIILLTTNDVQFGVCQICALTLSMSCCFSHAEVLATLWHCTMLKAVEGSYMSTGRIPCHEMKTYSPKSWDHWFLDEKMCQVCKKMKIRGAGGIIYSLFFLHHLVSCLSIANFKCWNILRLFIWITLYEWISVDMHVYTLLITVCLSWTATLKKAQARPQRTRRPSLPSKAWFFSALEGAKSPPSRPTAKLVVGVPDLCHPHFWC